MPKRYGGRRKRKETLFEFRDLLGRPSWKEVDEAIHKTKLNTLKNVKDLILLHANCHKYHKIKDVDATCLDIIINHIDNEING